MGIAQHAASRTARLIERFEGLMRKHECTSRTVIEVYEDRWLGRSWLKNRAKIAFTRTLAPAYCAGCAGNVAFASKRKLFQRNAPLFLRQIGIEKQKVDPTP